MAKERTSDRWISLLQSLLLHGLVVGALVYGWWVFKQRTSQAVAALPPSIEAEAVDASALKNVQPAAAKKEPPPPQSQPEPESDAGPPTPSPEEIAQRKAEEKRVAEQSAERKQKEEEDAKRAAEQKRLADAKRKEEEKKKVEDARLRQQREQELRRSLEQEERLMAARSSGALSSWLSQITGRIQRAWLRPPSATPGIDCVVYVTQVPGGEVTNVRIGSCNGDQAVRESIEAAVYRASPLPQPPDPGLFERNLEIHFRPVD